MTETFETRTVEPWENVTVPDGVPPVDVTVAVKLTDWPEFDGFGDDVTVVEVAKLVWLICSVSVPLVLFCHPVEPAKLATMEWLPLAREEVLKVATPDVPTATFDARTVGPSVKVTLPTGVPPELVTEAVKVTICPCVAGFEEDERDVSVEFCTKAVVVPWLAEYELSPEYEAVIAFEPDGSVDVAKLAPPFERVRVASVVEPNVNVT